MSAISSAKQHSMNDLIHCRSQITTRMKLLQDALSNLIHKQPIANATQLTEAFGIQIPQVLSTRDIKSIKETIKSHHKVLVKAKRIIAYKIELLKPQEPMMEIQQEIQMQCENETPHEIVSYLRKKMRDIRHEAVMKIINNIRYS